MISLFPATSSSSKSETRRHSQLRHIICLASPWFSLSCPSGRTSSKHLSQKELARYPHQITTSCLLSTAQFWTVTDKRCQQFNNDYLKCLPDSVRNCKTFNCSMKSLIKENCPILVLCYFSPKCFWYI